MVTKLTKYAIPEGNSMKNGIYDIDASYGWLIGTASQQINQRLTRTFAEHGLDITTEQWCLLVHLMNEDGLSQQELASRYMRSKVTVFKLISLLEKKEFIYRVADPKDGRIKRVYLTDHAKEHQALMVRLAQENLAMAMRGCPEDQLDTLRECLRAIIKNTK